MQHANTETAETAAASVDAERNYSRAATLLDGKGIIDWANLAINKLAQYREEINGLNVFPVPDADTGTNMLHTMRAAAANAQRSQGTESHTAAGAREVAIALGQGAVRGARGNSGVILSQVLRALGESASFVGLDAQTFKRTLRTAVILVEHSLSEPVEGTIVTVLREASAAAQQCSAADLAEVARIAADAAAEALAQTPEQLPALSSAGVVDAGGRGLLVLLDSLVEILDGEAPQRPDYAHMREQAPQQRATADAEADGETRGNETSTQHRCPQHTAQTAGTAAARARAAAHDDPESYRFEVMYSLHLSSEAKTESLRDELRGVGDSVIVVGDGAPGDLARWSVHVHCNDVGAAIEMGLAAGTVSEIRVTELYEDTDAPSQDDGRTVVAFVHQGPLTELFTQAGARTIDPGVAEYELVDALLAVGSRELIVLPNGELSRAAIAAVDAELRSHGCHVIIIPTQSVVQGLAALAVHDPETSLSLDGFGMADAATATKFAHLETAQRRALTLVGPCAAGDVLGIIGHDVAVIESGPEAALDAVIDALTAGGGELLTLITGPDLDAEVVARTKERVQRAHPELEVATYTGGPEDALASIGLE